VARIPLVSLASLTGLELKVIILLLLYVFYIIAETMGKEQGFVMIKMYSSSSG